MAPINSGWWRQAAGLAALSLILVACKTDAPTGRCLMIGSDVALELDFDDPVAITVEAQTAEGRSWTATSYATITRGIRQVTIIRPPINGDLRLTLGIDGKLFDRADGSVLADGSQTIIESLNSRPVDIRDARITAQLQVSRGTIATVSLDETAKTTKTSTRTFPR